MDCEQHNKLVDGERSIYQYSDVDPRLKPRSFKLDVFFVSKSLENSGIKEFFLKKKIANVS